MSIINKTSALFAKTSVKNKIVLSTLIAVLMISVAIAFVARWILVSSLTSELELRGSVIASSISERGGSFILENDRPKLLSLIFDEAWLHERRHLVSYIFILDRHGEVLAHTFTRKFPKQLLVNKVKPGEEKSVMLIKLDNQSVQDIAVPMTEGLYRIGTVHVGLSKSHIDSLVSKLRFAFLGFISGVVLIVLLLSNRFSRHIAQPITNLTKVADEISRGNFEVMFGYEAEVEGWDPSDCPAYTNTDLPCWHVDRPTGDDGRTGVPTQPMPSCKRCVFYRKRKGDEVVQLGDSFRNMLWSIKLYRRRLRESEEKYRSLFDSGPDPIFVVDCDTYCIVDANPRAVELYGYSKEELIGNSFFMLGPEHDQENLALFKEGTGTGCAYYPKILHFKKGENPFFVNVHACPISYRGKHAIIIAVTDITEMIEKDAQLIQAAKMKSLGEMSAGIAHEVNQPLNAIKMGCEFLSLVEEQGHDLPKEQYIEMVSEISFQVDRAAEIITTLRSFGRKADLIKERIDINQPITGILSIVRRQLELDNVRFHLDLEEGLPPILGHDNRLQQVFFNLITNAWDALNEKGMDSGDRIISIRTYREGDKVLAEVSDTGVGIAEVDKTKIFEPFYTTKEAGQGMGLGLAISYGIVKDYGGEFMIKSKVGEGTRFTLVFPAVSQLGKE